MATFNELNTEAKREYVEQGLAHFSALKKIILGLPDVKKQALADGDDEDTAQAIVDRRETRLADAMKPLPTPDSVMAEIAENLANLPVAEPPPEVVE